MGSDGVFHGAICQPLSANGNKQANTAVSQLLDNNG